MQREAALVFHLDLVASPDDHRVDERHDLVRLGAEHEHALEDADLRRREADAPRFHHQRRHPLDEAAEVVVERLDGLRLHPQHGVRVLPDLRERHLPPRLALGVELLLDAYLSLYLGHQRAH